MRKSLRVLVVFGRRNEDGKAFASFFLGKGHTAVLTQGGECALLTLRDNGSFDVVVIDARLFYKAGMRLIDVLLNVNPFQQYVLIAADASVTYRLIENRNYPDRNVLAHPFMPEVLLSRVLELCL